MRRAFSVLSLAIALFALGCGGDAHEEAPAAGSAAAIAKAPPGAVGAEVGRPASPALADLEPTPIKKSAPGTKPGPVTPEPTAAPLGGAGGPAKGTEL